MREQEQLQLRNGFGDALSVAFEMVVTPAIFGFLGYLLDRQIGTTPIFLATFSVLTLAYMVWKTYAKYELQMQREETRMRERRDERRADRLAELSSIETTTELAP